MRRAAKLLADARRASASCRAFSNLPEATVYGGPAPRSARVTVRTLAAKYAKGDIITMVTAYDYPSAVHVRRLAELGRLLLARS